MCILVRNDIRRYHTLSIINNIHDVIFAIYLKFGDQKNNIIKDIDNVEERPTLDFIVNNLWLRIIKLSVGNRII